MKPRLLTFRTLGVFLLLCGFGAVWAGTVFERAPRVLVFSKTAGFRHASIEAGVAAVERLGQAHGFEVEATEDAAVFNEDDLKRFQAVIFLNTTGDVLTVAQQNDFERFVQAGGGYVGVHAATDTEYDWPWYGRLAGAYFTSHPNNPNVREGTFHVVDHDHPATEGMPDSFTRRDEFYNFRDLNPATNVLVTIDETSYEGGTNGPDHPMSWYHAYDGGRAFYTAMGHTEESFSEPLFLQHLLGGIQYALGDAEPLDYGRARTKRTPEENRFNKVILAAPLNEPMELVVLDDERVLFIERRGDVKLYRPETGAAEVIATIPVTTTYTDGSQAEDGLLGLAVDPDFATNHWVYLYYSPAGDDPKNVLARYEFRDDDLVESTRTVILEVPVQRDQCCHTGGSMDWDADGNLYLSTGDNTNPHGTGYAPIDERPGRSPWDAQKSSANTNDLRGKILRIKPQPDGSYTIPDGNLFTPGTPNTRPEIYTMGHRNPFRIDVDARTGYLYWGDVGPDASRDSVDRGPAGHDEFGQARAAGNYGWPYFVGDNKAYHDYDFATQTPGAAFDAARPQNLSPNNTGRQFLPPAREAFIWYPAGPSPVFPLVGSGGRTAMAGPVYYRDAFAGAARPFPEYYDEKLFIYEWMRGWIMAVTMDEDGDFVSMERFMPNHTFSNPMDMQFGPNGDLYVLEYGTRWFQGNEDARLVRIEYTAGNRPPAVAAAVDRAAGATPLAVTFSSEGTIDYDGDDLSYTWTITDGAGREVARLTAPSPSYTFETPGVYTAALTVVDAEGARATAQTAVVAGNEPPRVAIELVGGNRSFYLPGKAIEYAVHVDDREDGSLDDGRIGGGEVAVTAAFLREGYDQVAVAQGHRAADAAAVHAAARRLMEGSTCLSCHQIDASSIGPSYLQVAERYADDPGATTHLVTKIREGGAGVWGDVMMPPHPQLSEAEAGQIAAYILSLDDVQPEAPSLPVAGAYVPEVPADAAGQGAVVLRAAYTDRGADGLPPASAEEVLVLRSPTVGATTADVLERVRAFSVPNQPLEIAIVDGDGAYLAFEDVDLTGIEAIALTASAPTPYLNAAGGTIEVRIGAPDGTLLGTSNAIAPTEDFQSSTVLEVDLKPTEGVHDVYLVGRNPDAADDRTLFILTTVHFGGIDAWGGGTTGDAGLSIDSTIEDLLAHEGARAVLERHLPGFTTDPRLDQAMEMSLKQVAPYAPTVLTDEVLEALNADLTKL